MDELTVYIDQGPCRIVFASASPLSVVRGIAGASKLWYLSVRPHRNGKDETNNSQLHFQAMYWAQQQGQDLFMNPGLSCSRGRVHPFPKR